MAASFRISSVTYDSVTIRITVDSAYSYYRIFIREASESEAVFDRWYYISSSSSREIAGLVPGTDYVINVAYSPDGTADNATWIGSQDFTTEEEPTYCYARLRLDANGGSGGPGTLYGESVDGTGYVKFNIPDYDIPTRDGYEFVCWAANASGTGTIRYPGDTYTVYGSASYPGTLHTLYAVWEALEYSVTVKYNANGGSGAPSSHTVTGNSSSLTVTLSSVAPTRSGYIFAGWATSSTATTAAYSAGQRLTNVYATVAGYTWNLYAVWVEELTGLARIGNGTGFNKATPYLRTANGWEKAVPYVWNDSWKKGV